MKPGNRKKQTTILKHHKDPSSKSLPTKSANLIGDEQQESLIQGRKRRSNWLRGESVRIGMSNGTEQTRKRAAPGDSNWLPSGWRVEDKVRTSGATAGSVDKVYKISSLCSLLQCSYVIKILPLDKINRLVWVWSCMLMVLCFAVLLRTNHGT